MFTTLYNFKLQLCSDLTHGEAVPLLVAQETVLDLGGPEVLLVGAGHHEAALGGEKCLEAVT